MAPGDTPFSWSAGFVRNSDWWWTAVSANGRYVSYAAPSGPGSPAIEVFRRDMLTGAIVVVSTGRAAGLPSPPPATHPAISADGSRAAFSSVANIGDLALYSGRHVYLRDLNAGTTTLVSSPGLPVAAADASDWPSLDASGNVVAFVSSASNLVATPLNAVPNVLARDLRTGVTTLVSKGYGSAAANGACSSPSVSRDGRYVAFQSVADNLKVSGTTYPYYALFVLDRSTGALTATGKQTLQIASDSDSSTQFTSDGRYVVFSSESTALVSADTNRSRDVFLFDYKYRPAPTLTTPTLSTKYVRRYRYFTIYGKVSKHTGSRGKVDIRLYRRTNSGYKFYKTYTVYTGTSSTSFKKTLRLPYTGKWCVRTYHPECGVYASKYSSYRYFTVYR
jgi:Tol biopolymer transport system component